MREVRGIKNDKSSKKESWELGLSIEAPKIKIKSHGGMNVPSDIIRKITRKTLLLFFSGKLFISIPFF